MTPELWAQMKEVFSAAMEKPAGEREAFLEEACPDAAVREEVRKLLAAENRPALEGPIAGKPARGNLPAVIGRYRIIRLLGEGGMGAVYEAEQEQPRRRVALKAIRAGLASPEMLRRFEHEAQALGRLHHPGIAQIYEAGAADTGFGPQPYFAMEFIHGASLVRYAEEHRLNTQQRLELMARICEAVHHAHQRGIIHRDLKPGNILVDETGQPKIVDFGVARATDLDAQATRQTDSGQILGTLAYMSPEQVLADPLELDTRSDVYALGVILYELLAGRLPYQVSGLLPQAVQTIREEDPARLSSIDRTYRGDVETIAAKAMEKDKARRYSSAAELGADIQRYLRNEPIVARRSTAAYQLRKFARRHSALVAGVAAAFFMLTAGVVASTWEAAQARRAEQEALRQRDRAAAAQRTAQSERDRAVAAEQAATEERNRALAEKQHADTASAASKAISDFLQNDLLAQASAENQARPDNRPDSDLKVRTALDRAAARIAGRFDSQPLVEADIRNTIALTYKQLGIYPEAQRQYERVRELRQRVLGADHRDTLRSMHALASVYTAQGKYALAEALMLQALRGERRVLGENSVDAHITAGGLASIYLLEGRLAEAEPLTVEAVDFRLRTSGPENPETLIAMNNLAVLYGQEGKHAEAEQLYTKVLEIRRRINGPEHPHTLNVMNNLSVALFSQGKYVAAESLLAPLVETTRRVLGDEHPWTLDVLYNLAFVYRCEGKLAAAEPLALKNLEVWRRTLGEQHPRTLSGATQLAVVYRLEGRFAEAETIATKTVETQRRVLGERHPNVATGMTNLGTLYQEEGKSAEADALLTKALVLDRRVLGSEHVATGTCLTALAKLRLAQDRYVEAESLLRESLGPRITAGAYVWQPAERRSLLGLALMGQSRFAEAEAFLISGYRGLVERGSDLPATVSVRDAGVRLVQLYDSWGKPEKAAEWRKELDAAGVAWR